jgi:tocopherol O-methyltransferase
MVPTTREVGAAQIRSYYSETAFDYRALWFDRTNLAMHFGYHSSPDMPHSEALTNSNKVLADLADIKPGERVLDAGCGLGGSSLWLASNRTARVVGIALGEDQVRDAAREAKRMSLSGSARFLTADFTELPFPKNSFDVVWAQESLCHAHNKDQFFREAFRVLRRKGRVIIADGFLKRATVSAKERALLRQWYDGWRLAGLWTAAQHANAATAAGFSRLSITDVTENMRASQRLLSERAKRALPVAKLLSVIGVRSAAQDGNVVGALRQYEALKKECWFYGIMLAHKRQAGAPKHG